MEGERKFNRKEERVEITGRDQYIHTALLESSRKAGDRVLTGEEKETG